MSQEELNLSSIRRIHDARDVGAAESGQQVVLNLRMEDGSTEWFAIQHAKVGRLVAGVMFGAAVAARDRPKTSPLGTPLPELSSVIDITGVNATAVPGEDFIALRMVVGEGVTLDFRLPLSSISQVQEKIDQAIAFARSSDRPSSH